MKFEIPKFAFEKQPKGFESAYAKLTPEELLIRANILQAELAEYAHSEKSSATLLDPDAEAHFEEINDRMIYIKELLAKKGYTIHF